MQLHFKQLGEGHPLIILHGLFGMLDNWQTLARQFAEYFTVYTLDLRNHGRSPHNEEMDYYVMAQDIADFMDAQSLDTAYVLGHSMGGKVAMQLAADFPEMVDKLIVVDIAPKEYESGHEEIFEAFFSVELAEVKNRKEAETQMEKVLKDFGVRQFLLKNLYRDKAGSYHWRANLEDIQKTYPAIIQNSLGPFHQFDYPTLFIKGGQSERYIEMDDWATILGYFPEAKLEVVAEAGHWVHAEQPQQLFDLVVNFLKED